MFTFAQIKFPLTLNSAYDDVILLQFHPSSLISITRRHRQHHQNFSSYFTALISLRGYKYGLFTSGRSGPHLDLDTNLPLTTWAATTEQKYAIALLKNDCASMVSGRHQGGIGSALPSRLILHIPAQQTLTVRPSEYIRKSSGRPFNWQTKRPNRMFER